MRNPFRKTRQPMQDRTDRKPEDELLGDIPTPDAENAPEAIDPNAGSEPDNLERVAAERDAMKVERDALHDKYVRLHADFENFRKRNAKERLELLMTAGSETVKSILPVLDDMERAIAHNAEVTDIEAMKTGFELIHQKFIGILAARGVKPMQAKGEVFDADMHDAISQAPAPSPELKGKVIDVLETGYLINDKVLRYAKVVVGQ
ncbi:MAG: nucleotide exchange factor GrpE [Flavobacteriales bacterium]|nr:nucleotide exchange factor GrpE [Flavobacteriales bacterium]